MMINFYSAHSESLMKTIFLFQQNYPDSQCSSKLHLHLYMSLYICLNPLPMVLCLKFMMCCDLYSMFSILSIVSVLILFCLTLKIICSSCIFC